MRWLIVKEMGTGFAEIMNVAIINAPDKDTAIKIFCERSRSENIWITAYNTETNEDFYFYT